MNHMISPAPVRKSVHVRAAPERAFETFSAGIEHWWPRSHSIGSSPIVRAVIEPEAGGRWYEQGEDGSECDWGKVLVWEPPTLLVLAWQIDGEWKYRPDLVTEVEVRFTPEDGGTRVDLEHRNLDRLGAAGEATRAAFDSPGGWSGMLETMATLAAA